MTIELDEHDGVSDKELIDAVWLWSCHFVLTSLTYRPFLQSLDLSQQESLDQIEMVVVVMMESIFDFGFVAVSAELMILEIVEVFRRLSRVVRIALFENFLPAMSDDSKSQAILEHYLVMMAMALKFEMMLP